MFCTITQLVFGPQAMRHAKVDDVRVSFKKERDGEELQEETVAFDSDSGILGPPHEQDKSEEDVQSPPCNAREETAAVQACDDDGKLDGGPNTVDTEEGTYSILNMWDHSN